MYQSAVEYFLGAQATQQHEVEEQLTIFSTIRAHYTSSITAGTSQVAEEKKTMSPMMANTGNPSGKTRPITLMQICRCL